MGSAKTTYVVRAGLPLSEAPNRGACTAIRHQRENREEKAISTKRARRRFEMGKAASLAQAVWLLLEGGVRAVTHPDRERGCMISSGTTACHPDHATLARDAAARRDAMRERIADALSSFAAKADAHRLARSLSAVMQGISVQARDGATPMELQRSLKRWFRVSKRGVHGTHEDFHRARRVTEYRAAADIAPAPFILYLDDLWPGSAAMQAPCKHRRPALVVPSPAPSVAGLCQRRASRIRLNGVCIALRKRVKPALRKMSLSLASPAWAPSTV